jgi:hypothetical protein
MKERNFCHTDIQPIRQRRRVAKKYKEAAAASTERTPTHVPLPHDITPGRGLGGEKRGSNQKKEEPRGAEKKEAEIHLLNSSHVVFGIRI